MKTSEYGLSYDDVVSLTNYIGAIDPSVIDNDKKIDLLQTGVLGLQSGRTFVEIVPAIDDMVKKWEEFITGKVDPHEFITNNCGDAPELHALLDAGSPTVH